MAISKHLRWAVVVTAVAAAGALGGAALVGAHGGDATRVHACVSDADGTVRITATHLPSGNPLAGCETGERAVDWAGVGPDAFSQYRFGDVKVVTRDSEFNEEMFKFVKVNCPKGNVAVGGGYDLNGLLTGRLVFESFPEPRARPDSWVVRAATAINIAGEAPWGVTGWAVCIGPKPPGPLKKTKNRKVRVDDRPVFPRR